MNKPGLRQATPTLGALAVFLLLAVVHTWPLASNPSGLSRNDNGDAMLNEWIVSWIAHQVVRDPLALFDANIFHPEPRTLAFSEPLLVPALAGAPIRWLGGSPVLTFNLLLLAGMVTTAFAGFYVTRSITGDWLAGILTGSLLAFNAQTLSRLPHLQAHHAQWIPLALLVYARLVERHRIRDAILLGVSVALLGLTSGYWAALGVVALGVAFLARADAWRRHASKHLRLVALAAGVAIGLAGPVLAPYATARDRQGLVRAASELEQFSAPPAAYLATPARLHHSTWSRPFYDRTAPRYFPGVICLLLAAVAVVLGGVREPWRRTLVPVAIVGFVLSLGTATPVYAWLHEALPPMQLLRDPSRFGYLVLLALAILAGLGLQELRSRGRLSRFAAVALIVAANAEALTAPLELEPFEGLPSVYAAVADEDEPLVLAELPFYPVEQVHRNAAYVLGSTAHFRPLLNGYSGFTPASYVERAEALREFPDDRAMDTLRRAGVTHVIVHFDRLLPGRAEYVRTALAERPELELIHGSEREIALYRLDAERSGASTTS